MKVYAKLVLVALISAFMIGVAQPERAQASDKAHYSSQQLGDEEPDTPGGSNAVPRYNPPRAQGSDVLSRTNELAGRFLHVDDGVEIHILAAGQADSMLIIGPGPEHKSLLVDLGEPVTHKTGNAALLYPRITQLLGGGTKVDYVLITHFHQDHVGMPGSGACSRLRNPTGLFALFDQAEGPFAAGELLDPGDDDSAYIPDHNSVHCGIDEEAQTWIENNAIGARKTPDFGTGSIDLGPGVSIDFVAVSGRVAPNQVGVMDELARTTPDLYSEDQPASENDRSIAFVLHFGRFTFFSGGDLTGSPIGAEDKLYEIRSFGRGKSEVYTNVESPLVKHWLQDGIVSRVDVYRANHHGSGHSSNGDLAKALSPSVVIISSGIDNGYGHPDPSVVEEFCAMGAREFVTSGVDSKKWPDGFPKRCGKIVKGEIDISVPPGGASYSVNGVAFKSH